MNMQKEKSNGISCIGVNELPDYFAYVRQSPIHNEPTPCPKGAIERLLEKGAEFFPDRMVIPRTIVPASDRDAVKTALYEGIQLKRSIGIRTTADRHIYCGGSLPWVLEIDTEEKAQNFMDITLPIWHTNARHHNYTINNLILMQNPPEIGTYAAKPNQFVCRLSWNDFASFNCSESCLTTEMTMGTNQLRSLDARMDKDQSRIVRFQTFYKPTGFMDRKGMRFGSALVNNRTAQENVKFVVQYIEDAMADPDIRLLRRLEFFAGMGLNMLEFQGYRDTKTNKRYMYIYGLRGMGDDTRTGLRPSRINEGSY